MATTRTRNSNLYPLRIDTGANHTAISMLPSQNIQAPKPRRPASQMQIHHLDGTPYGMKPKTRKTIVAKDMYNGQEPPQYKAKASYPDLRQSSIPTSQPATSCATCGKQRSSTDLNRSVNPSNECNTCGKRKVITPEPSPVILPPPQIRSVSEASSSTLVNTTAHDSADSTTPAPKRKCVKCGRAKKPTALASPPAAITNTTTRSQPQASTPEPNGLTFPTPPPTTHIASQHIMYTSTPPPRPTSVVPKRKPIPSQLMPGYRPLEVPTRTAANIEIGIIPATATSEYAQPNLLHDDTPVSISQKPLIPTPASQSPPKPRRSPSITSIASSITRSLTRRRRSNDSNTSNAVPEHSESNAGRLINMISSAIRGEADSSYARLEEDIDRRVNRSPFSFVSKVDDNAAVQLTALPPPIPRVPSTTTTTTAATTPDMKQSPRPSTSSSTYSTPSVKNPFADPTTTTTTSQGPESTSLLASLSRVTTPSRPTSLLPAHTAPELPTLSTLPTPPPIPQDDIFLATRPTELTRFKSLRSGVSRAGSVARSTSLKRLGSLKAAPQLWYRTDMAIEGAAVGVY